MIYAEGSGPGGNFLKMPLVPAAPATPLFARRLWGTGVSFSPDGRLIAFDAVESGRSEIFVRPFPDGEQRVQVSSGSGTNPLWGSTGEIFYASGSAISAVSVTNRGALAVSKPAAIVQTGGHTRLAPVFGVTPDGRTFFILRSRGREQLSLILKLDLGARAGGQRQITDRTGNSFLLAVAAGGIHREHGPAAVSLVRAR